MAQPEAKLSKKIMKAWRDRGAWVVLDNGCWDWQGATLPNGYPTQGDGRVHRMMYELHHGPLGKLQVDHTCHDPRECVGGKTCPHRRCVNPDHLQGVTAKQNLSAGRRANANALKTHCLQGHPYDDENTGRRWVKRSQSWARTCRACARERMRRRRRNGTA